MIVSRRLFRGLDPARAIALVAIVLAFGLGAVPHAHVTTADTPGHAAAMAEADHPDPAVAAMSGAMPAWRCTTASGCLVAAPLFTAAFVAPAPGAPALIVPGTDASAAPRYGLFRPPRHG